MDALNLMRNYRSENKQPTSLISLVVPNTDISNVRELIRKETSTASNIKGNSNRKSVLSALTKIKSIFFSMKTIPDTGIAVFSGEYI